MLKTSTFPPYAQRSGEKCGLAWLGMGVLGSFWTGTACWKDAPHSPLWQRGVHRTPGSRPGLSAAAATLLYKEDL